MIIQGNRVFVAGGFTKAQIHIDGREIRGVFPCNTNKPDIDYGDNMILPGLIDVHTHGAYGYSVNDGTEEGLFNWLSKLPDEGVTAFLPTTTTSTDAMTMAALKNIANVKDKIQKGAEILGAHLEGPFLNNEYRGAHDPRLLKPPDIALFETFQEVARGNIKYVTIAPEHDEGFEFTRHVSQTGTVVSIGHSSACASEVFLALANGSTSFTHSFNGMRALHQREPGVVGALMTSNSFAEIIADGHHVNPSIINILFKSKNYSKLILITDSMMGKGLPSGSYECEGMKFDVDEGGLARIHGTDTLAGSSLRMNMGIKFLVNRAMIPLECAILAATLYPAQMLGIEKRKGQIISFADADFTVLDDRFEVVQTYCLGKAML